MNEINKKYKLLKNDTILIGDRRFYRIEALKDFGNVKKGDKGGFVQGEHNLSHYENCWVYDNAKIFDNALVCGNAKVYDECRLTQNAKIFGYAEMHQKATASGYVEIFENAKIFDNVYIADYCSIKGFAELRNSAQIYGHVKIYGNAKISGSVEILDHARVYDFAEVTDLVKISENCRIFGNAKVSEFAVLKGSCYIYGRAIVKGKSIINNRANIFNNAIVSEQMHISFSKCDKDLTLKENLADNIRCQTGLAVLSDKKGDYVIGYKHVNKTDIPTVFKSKYDINFKYKIGQIAKVKNPDLSNRSSASGLHFSNLTYWEGNNLDTVIQVKCYLKDIITVQQGKIRCKKLLPMKVVKNGIE